MKTILATTYAVNPYKGSEDAMGWNYVMQIARFNKVIALTRENNQSDIERFMRDNPSEHYANVSFLYFDLPYWMRFWKKGGRGALLYFYLWQMGAPGFIKKTGIDFDIAHNLNFHNDWTPTFLWRLGRPLVWGPVGHHPAIPANFVMKHYSLKDLLIDRLRWLVKQTFWKTGIFLHLSGKRSSKVLCMNSGANKVLNLDQHKVITINSVCSEDHHIEKLSSDKFTALFVGRFVPLKGADVAIEAFARFYHALSAQQQKTVEFVLIGKGPSEEVLRGLIERHKLEGAVRIIHWMDRSELQNYYRKSSVFLFPSHEGAGMVVPEAMSYSMPVLAFDNIGPGEFINDSCGIKVPYSTYDKSVDDFSEAMHLLYTDTAFLKKLSEGAKACYKARFTWEKRGELLNDIYQGI